MQQFVSALQINSVADAVDILSALFVFAVGASALLILFLYVIDRTQTKHAIRRNYPVIGRLRYVMEDLGKYFRQYFFADDRAELPFPRAQRAWVYRAAKGVDTTVPFGSTRSLAHVGTKIFVNCPFPQLGDASEPPNDVVVGPYCRHPYTTDKFFHISGMSYGAISKPAVQALSRGAKRAGIWMNTGEGAMSPFHIEGGADIVFQIGTAKYGVRKDDGTLDDDKLRAVAEREQVRMFEIKLSQGAKPGKGGILPGEKVSKEIAKIRGIKQGKDSISPNRHPEVNSVGELLDFIAHIRDVTGKPTGIKLVLGAYGWLSGLCEEINRRGQESAPDFITLDSADGGTGAAPQPLIDYMGLQIQESLPTLVDALLVYGLRDRIKVVASGKLTTPSGVAWALCAGADFVTSARGFMFALGCIQALQCNTNECPSGVATHKKHLQRGLVATDKAERVYRYASTMHKEVGTVAHSCGVDDPRMLKRHHCRIMGANSRTIGLHEMFPPGGSFKPATDKPDTITDGSAGRSSSAAAQ
jgi:glutamate synthase domain-containing protein 2